jgi:hypothetical protein
MKKSNLLFVALCLAVCTSPGCTLLSGGVGPTPPQIYTDGLVNSSVALTGIGPYNNRFFHASVLSKNGRYGGIASLELWPLGGIGIGFVGARVKILPIEFALGVLGYDATPVGTWEAEDSDESDAD